jgi:hypothetical protein
MTMCALTRDAAMALGAHHYTAYIGSPDFMDAMLESP